MGEAGAPGVWDVGAIVDGGIGHVDEGHVDADFLGELIAETPAKVIGGGGGEKLALVFLFVGVAAEVIFFFEKQPIFFAQEICGGKASHAAADDHDFGCAGGVGLGEGVAVANLVAHGEVFAFDERGGLVGSGLRQQRIVDGTAGSDGACDHELDEITASVRHADGPPKVVREACELLCQWNECERGTRSG